MVKTIRIEDDKVKERFDSVQRTESASRDKSLTQTETMDILVKLWEDIEAGVLEVKPK